MPWVVCSTDSQARVAADPAGGVQPGTPGSLGSMGELNGLVSAVCLPGSQFSSPGDPRQSSEWPSDLSRQRGCAVGVPSRAEAKAVLHEVRCQTRRGDKGCRAGKG